MYIINIDSDDASKDSLLRAPQAAASASPTAEVVLLRTLNTPLNNSQIGVNPQIFAPNGFNQSKISDLIAQAGVIISIGTFQLNNTAGPTPFGGAISSSSNPEGNASFAQNILAHLSSNESAVPVVNLSDVNLGQNIPGITGTPGTPSQNLLTDSNIASYGSSNTPQAIIDVSSLAASGSPVVVTALSDNSVTVISSISSNVQIQELIAPLATSEYFINTNKVGILSVTTTATNVSSLSLSDNVAFTSKADEVTSGITVSGEADSSSVSLFITGGASRQQNGTDVITLGNGDNHIFDAGNGQILLSLGSGQNTVILAGVGVTGQINLATHTNSVADSISVAANGKSSANVLASHALVTITGFNNSAQSQDTIHFLGDQNTTLAWAGGTGSTAQVQSVDGDPSSLVNWVVAAKTQASSAHSVAWFQFGGNTYVFEAAKDISAGYVGDTLIKLVGLTHFSGSSAELMPGTLHLAG